MKKVALDILEIYVVSKFDPVPMKIVAGSSLEQQQTTDISAPQYTNIVHGCRFSKILGLQPSNFTSLLGRAECVMLVSMRGRKI